MVKKVCRLCGKRTNNCLEISKFKRKIMNVFPVLIWATDSLPQNICKPCLQDVSVIYKKIEEVTQAQKKLIKTLREAQPKNNYIQIIDAIQNAKCPMEKYLMEITKEPLVVQMCLERLLHSPNGILDKTTNQREIIFESSSNDDTTNQVDLKSNEALLIKEKTVKNKTLDSHNPSQVPLTLHCKGCKKTFNSIVALYMHQSEHLRVKLKRIFPKKILKKDERRGRVVKGLNNQKLIRCLSCLQLFKTQNDAFLHWEQSQCDFYCKGCGKEFINQPNELRKHKISCSCLKAIQENQIDNATKKTLPKSRGKEVVAKDPAKCQICDKTFQRKSACNSHMRSHKVSFHVGGLMVPTTNESEMACAVSYDECFPQFVKNEKETSTNVNFESIDKSCEPVESNKDLSAPTTSQGSPCGGASNQNTQSMEESWDNINAQTTNPMTTFSYESNEYKEVGLHQPIIIKEEPSDFETLV